MTSFMTISFSFAVSARKKLSEHDAAPTYRCLVDGSSPIDFGMHRDHCYQNVLDIHPSYTNWCSSCHDPSKHVDDLFKRAEQRTRQALRVAICRDVASHKLMPPAKGHIICLHTCGTINLLRNGVPYSPFLRPQI